MRKTDVGDLVSPCCGTPLLTIAYPEYGGAFEYAVEIQCSNCSNLWDSEGRFESY